MTLEHLEAVRWRVRNAREFERAYTTCHPQASNRDAEALLAEIDRLRAENAALRGYPAPLGECPTHGRPLVRIAYAAASACPECLALERDEEIAAREKREAAPGLPAPQQVVIMHPKKRIEDGKDGP